MIVMKNYIMIKDGTIYQTGISQGSDEVYVFFADVTTMTNKVEVFKGDEYHSVVDCITTGGTALAKLPDEIYTGSLVHFRLLGDGIPGKFYHIVINPEKDLMLSPESFVVLSNLREVAIANELSGLYGMMALLTHGELSDYTNDQIGGGQIG